MALSQPLIGQGEILLVVPVSGEGYALRQTLATAFELLSYYDDDTEDFICCNVNALTAISLREPVAQAYLEHNAALNPECDCVPPFVWSSKAWQQFLAQFLSEQKNSPKAFGGGHCSGLSL